MKIGILTLYYNNPNYGGLLQSYALQKSIELLGYESEQISYDYKTDSFIGLSKTKYLIKRSIRKFIPGYRFYNNKFEKTLRLFEKKIPHSKRVVKNNIKSLNSEYDVFICGSDQIWNPIGWSPLFFLDFTFKPKVSYAPSVARDSLSDDEVKFISNFTSSFSSLSVRERNTADFLSQTLKRDFKLVPDPTLLLSKEEWEAYLINREQSMISFQRPYIFAYFLGYNQKQRDDCIKFAKDRGLDIYFVPFMKKESYSWDRKNLEYAVENLKVENFIDLVRNAELVLTDSFHGAVFSCIFERPFYVLNRQLIGNEKSMNSRLHTLFYHLKIDRSRMIDEVLSINNYKFTENELKDIVESKDKCKISGLRYLEKALRKVKENE